MQLPLWFLYSLVINYVCFAVCVVEYHINQSGIADLDVKLVRAVLIVETLMRLVVRGLCISVYI